MSLNISRVRLICFDVDGTLRNTDDEMVRRLATWLSAITWLSPKHDEHALARGLVMALENPGNLTLTWLDRLHLDELAVALTERKRHPVGRTAPARPEPIPGAFATLEALSLRYLLAVISARGRRGTDAFLESSGLARFFACVASGQTTRRTKPHPQPLLWVASQLGVPPQACLMVGDTVPDIACGLAAGAQTVGVLSGFGEQAELVAAGANLILPDVSYLPAALAYG